MCVCVCVRVRAGVCTGLYKCARLFMFIWSFVSMSACGCIYILMHIFANLSTLCKFKYVCVCMCANVSAFACMRVRMYAYPSL